MDVSLRPYVDRDLALTLELETDPVVMAELGGPRSREALVRVHGVRVREPGSFVIEDDGRSVGFVAWWPSEHDGAAIHETGWMVLPADHGRGVASAALGILLEHAREDPQVTALHAFPGVANRASNRLCDRFAFADLGEVEVDFGEHLLRTRHRRLDLASD